MDTQISGREQFSNTYLKLVPTLVAFVVKFEHEMSSGEIIVKRFLIPPSLEVHLCPFPTQLSWRIACN